jgi:hypothetical protein
MAEQAPEYDPAMRGLRKAIHDALLKHPKIRASEAGVRCAGRGCDWQKPPAGNKNTTQRFVNHQTFEVQQAVTEWYYADRKG